MKKRCGPRRARPWWLLAVLCLGARGEQAFVWRDTGDGQIELRERGRPALTYNYGPQLRAGAPEKFRRCCYVFPLYTPAGVSMLDDFPKDHWHHRGLFWAWPVVETEGATYDLWMTTTAKHRASSPPATKAGRSARLDADNVWEAGGQPIVREHVRLTVFPSLGPSREIEMVLTWEALRSPVTLRGSRETGKSYGGFSARFAPRDGTALRADDQELVRDEDLSPHRWAELEASYGGKRAALRIAPDPANPGAPYQWCLRQYGFVGASFPGRTPAADGHTLAPGKPLTLRFRVRASDAN